MSASRTRPHSRRRVPRSPGMAGVADAQSITALGVSQVKVVAPAPLTNAKIVKAVSPARKLAVPQAVETARNQATRIAIAAGLQPGPVLEVVETAPGPVQLLLRPRHLRPLRPPPVLRAGAEREARAES